MNVLILAAGASSRTAPLDKLTDVRKMLRTVAQRYLDADIGHVNIVVGGAHMRARKKTIADLPVRVIEFDNAQNGMGASLAFGLSQLSRDEPAMIALADMPLVKTSTIQALAKFHQHGCISIPVYDEKHGHPVIFDQVYFDELCALDADRGGRDVINAHADQVRYFFTDDAGVITDFDYIT